ncbi:hypothetical protein N656DRAFT_367240 [Canariomyces notabilis]|uniref:RING-type domain-containing protein n=1 Tax=Canariomyces notabilis TaxID=2074819 RepID=A0AAN6QEW3_9PEZI|nr:hypothetical protein N656DRAFT_367240 [Canariomyces arenarius]
MIRQHSLPCFFFCGHIVCRGCLDKEVRLHSLRPRKCPVCMEPFNSDVAGECQHVLFHVLDPGPDGADNLDLCPLTKSEGGELPDLCWNCENLELVVETDSRTSIRKFSAELNLWMLRPYTVIAFHYRHRELGAKRREGRLEVFRGSRTQLIFGLSDLRPVRDATWLGTWRKRCYGFIEKVMVDYETWDSLLPPTLFVLHHVE